MTIGIGVGREGVRAVAVRAGRIEWALERARADDPLAETIGEVLAHAPIARWRRPRVIVAVGPAHAQAKLLAGLPPVRDSSRLGDVIRESVARFFLKNGIPVVTAYRASADGRPWGAAVEQPVLEAIENACRHRRVKLAAIVPTVFVLGRFTDDAGTARMHWTDCEVCVDVAFEDGELVAVRRTIGPSTLTADESPRSAALAVLGPNSFRFADALGAARARPESVLAWRGQRDTGGHAAPHWRLALAAIAMILAGAACIVAPGIVARLAERNASADLAKLAPVRRDVTFAEREFAKLTAALSEVAAFDGPRYPMTPLLADLTHALPDESALVTLRIARNEGNLVALTPRAAVVVTRLETIPGIEGAEIIGPVTREVLLGKALERVTIRFRVNAPLRRTRHLPAGGGT